MISTVLGDTLPLTEYTGPVIQPFIQRFIHVFFEVDKLNVGVDVDFIMQKVQVSRHRCSTWTLSESDQSEPCVMQEIQEQRKENC